jgi:hypothetical protein
LIVNIIHYVKEVFCDPIYIQEYKKYLLSLNHRGKKGIGSLIQKEIEKYCEDSYRKRFLSEDSTPSSSVSFSQLNDSMKIFLEKVSHLNKAANNMTVSQKVTEMNQWFTESFLNIVKDEVEQQIEKENE